MNDSRATPSSSDPDTVRRAMDLLAADRQLDQPDAQLEQQLLAAAQQRTANRNWSVARIARWVASVTIVLALLSATMQTTGVLDSLRNWWYSIRIGDHEVRGTQNGPGEVRANYTTADGFDVTVQVARDRTANGATRTNVRAREVGPGEVTEEQFLYVPRAEVDDLQFTAEVLAGTRVLHTWISADGHQLVLHLAATNQEPGTRLYVHDLSTQTARPVSQILAAPHLLGVGGKVTVTESASGRLRVLLRGRGGWEVEVVCGGSAANQATPTEFSTPSGRTRVRVSDSPAREKR